MENPNSSFNLYRFQQRSFPILLGWALGSIASGVFWMTSRTGVLSGLGSQFAGWGVVNLILAVLGLRGARRSLQRQAQGDISPAEHARQARNFERLVLVNAGLDLGYIAFGAWLAQKPSRQPEKKPGLRKGVSWGIAAQGAFLLIWDSLLTLLVREGRKA
jgi:hypothetical protein